MVKHPVKRPETAREPSPPRKVEARIGWLKERRGTLVSLGLLAFLSVVAFANTFANDFAFDDQRIIVENRLIKSLKFLPTLFTTGYWAGSREVEEIADQLGGGGLYRPLVLATYAFNYAIGGLHPLGYHLVNFLLHIVVSLLLYGLARQLGLSGGAALAASALFAVHPLHTEAVTGIVGRAELLMALGVLLALSWYNRGGGQARSRLASLGAFIVALLAKEQAMMLPAILILYDLAMAKEPGAWKGLLRHAWRRYLGYVLILGAFLILRTAVLGSLLWKVQFLDNPLAHVAWWPRVLTALKVAGKYLWLFVWPAKLSADYSYNAIPIASSLSEPAVLLALLAWGGLLALAGASFVRGRRLTFFSIGFTFLTFLPASNLLVPIGTIMGERLFYLPSAGLCMVVGAGWDRGAAWARQQGRSFWLTRVGLGVFTLMLLLLTARTLQRNRDWRTSKTLFESAVHVAPQSAKVHLNRGIHKDEVEEALREFEEAIRIYPEYPARHWELDLGYGAALVKAGRLEEAIATLERGVRLKPKRPEGHFNLGLAYAKQGRYEEAEAAYRRALTLQMDEPAIYNSLSFVLLKQERFDEALLAAEDAIRLEPSRAEAYYLQGRALEGLGRIGEAVAAYEQALQLKPDFSLAKQRLAELRQRSSR